MAPPMRGLGLLHQLLSAVTSFDSLETTELDDGGWIEEEKDFNLGPDADALPLCEDLNEGTVGNGDSCWSTCDGQCPNDILKPGLTFDFDEIKDGHPGCSSGFECNGNKDRVLCHAVRGAEEARAPDVRLAILLSARPAVAPTACARLAGGRAALLLRARRPTVDTHRRRRRSGRPQLEAARAFL
mmetsp:Transcript_72327/g.203014  ORF Transcript_72327/g.203014 Transcript_72327/m.203014 type:complete len:185 (+) Transcript_72327:37-591(+)